jgi:hypothetical protein
VRRSRAGDANKACSTATLTRLLTLAHAAPDAARIGGCLGLRRLSVQS